MTTSYSPRDIDVVLRDGSSVRIRAAKPTDEVAIVAFLNGLSDASRTLRFGGGSTDLVATAKGWTDPGCTDCCVLAVLGGEIVGQASYDCLAADRAKVGFNVADSFQGRGVGTLLLKRLAEAAEADGVSLFEADVVPDNHRMLEVFKESGFGITMKSEPGLVHVQFATSISAEARARFEAREQVSAMNAVRGMLAPRSVAVIGAGRKRGTIGGEVFHNLMDGGFNGPVYPVNPGAEVVQSVRAYKSILDIDGPVDLAVIVVPAKLTMQAARECAQKGVHGMVVITAGFGETGPAGKEMQRELLTIAREAGMRVIGPNCMGVINTHDDVRMNATFSPNAPLQGNVGFLSQSGALGLAVIEYANTLNLGLSTFISVGNKADLSGNDFIQYWAEDPATDVIALYLESLGNPRKFARITRRVGRHKPILAVKSGRSSAGDPDQRRRPRHPLRRCVRSRRLDRAPGSGRHQGQAGRVPAGRCRTQQPGRHDRGGTRRVVPQSPQAPCQMGRHRRHHHLVRPGTRDQLRGDRRRRPRRLPRDRARNPDAVRLPLERGYPEFPQDRRPLSPFLSVPRGRRSRSRPRRSVRHMGRDPRGCRSAVRRYS